MAICRGDLVTVVLADEYGKPRPALIIQSDLFREHSSVTVLPVTSFLRSAEVCLGNPGEAERDSGRS